MRLDYFYRGFSGWRSKGLAIRPEPILYTYSVRFQRAQDALHTRPKNDAQPSASYVPKKQCLADKSTTPFRTGRHAPGPDLSELSTLTMHTFSEMQEIQWVVDMNTP